VTAPGHSIGALEEREHWRIAADAPRGPGTIVLAEHGAQKFYRGEGVFLGWPQDRLEAAYRALLPPPQGKSEDHLQLG